MVLTRFSTSATSSATLLLASEPLEPLRDRTTDRA